MPDLAIPTTSLPDFPFPDGADAFIQNTVLPGENPFDALSSCHLDVQNANPKSGGPKSKFVFRIGVITAAMVVLLVVAGMIFLGGTPANKGEVASHTDASGKDDDQSVSEEDSPKNSNDDDEMGNSTRNSSDGKERKTNFVRSPGALETFVVQFPIEDGPPRQAILWSELENADEEIAVYLYNNASAELALENLRYIPKVKTLHAVGCNLSDEAVSCLLEMPQLTKVNMSGSNISDNSLEYLAKLPHLTTLNLSRCSRITDRGLGNLSKSISITEISLQNSSDRITDQGIDFLALMPQLKWVNLYALRNYRGRGHFAAVAIIQGIRMDVESSKR